MTLQILGSGINGLVAGISAKKTNSELKVEIYEKRNRIGGSFKSTVHGLLNYNNIFEEDIIEFLTSTVGLEIQSSYYPIYKLRRYAPNGRSYQVYSTTKPLIYNFLRGNMDGTLENELLTQATDLGIKINYNSELKIEDCNIISTGAQHSDFKGYGIHYHDVKLDDFSEVKVFFNYEFAPGGYAYILPYKNNSATFAIFTKTSMTKESLEIYFDKFLQYIQKTFNIKKGQAVVSIDSGMGSYNLYEKLFKNDIIYSGVRAGLMTADYGFAMKEALISGFLAGKHYNNMMEYNSEVKRYLWASLSDAYLKRMLLDRYNNDDFNKMINGKKDKEFIFEKLKRNFIKESLVKLLIIKHRRQYPL